MGRCARAWGWRGTLEVLSEWLLEVLHLPFQPPPTTHHPPPTNPPPPHPHKGVHTTHRRWCNSIHTEQFKFSHCTRLPWQLTPTQSIVPATSLHSIGKLQSMERVQPSWSCRRSSISGGCNKHAQQPATEGLAPEPAGGASDTVEVSALIADHTRLGRDLAQAGTAVVHDHCIALLARSHSGAFTFPFLSRPEQFFFALFWNGE